MLHLFEALADLYGNKCKAQGIIIKRSNGDYTSTFQRWTKKLYEAQISSEDMRHGIWKLEEKLRDDLRVGNESWPPGYAEFIGHCRAYKKRLTAAHKMYQQLPAPSLTNEEQKKKMKELRGSLGL